MKFFDINRKFTEKVTEYIAKDYTINSHTMAGSQGEIGKIDLVKGNELIRIWLDTEHDWKWKDENGFYGNKIMLRVSRWVKDYDPRIDETVWMSHLNHIEEYTFYELGRFRNKWYLDNLDEVLACIKKQDDRRVKYKSETFLVDITSDATKEIAAKYLKNHEGYQRVSRDRIHLIKRVYHNEFKSDYIIRYNDTQVYKLK